MKFQKLVEKTSKVIDDAEMIEFASDLKDQNLSDKDIIQKLKSGYNISDKEAKLITKLLS